MEKSVGQSPLVPSDPKRSDREFEAANRFRNVCAGVLLAGRERVSDGANLQRRSHLIRVLMYTMPAKRSENIRNGCGTLIGPHGRIDERKRRAGQPPDSDVPNGRVYRERGRRNDGVWFRFLVRLHRKEIQENTCPDEAMRRAKKNKRQTRRETELRQSHEEEDLTGKEIGTMRRMSQASP